MYLFAAIFGLGLGGEYLIIPLMAAELFGVKFLGRLMGILLTADGVAEASFPMLIGHLRDRTGRYDTGFFVLIGIALLGAAAVALLPRGRSAELQLCESQDLETRRAGALRSDSEAK
jgi:MFS family permease